MEDFLFVFLIHWSHWTTKLELAVKNVSFLNPSDQCIRNTKRNPFLDVCLHLQVEVVKQYQRTGFMDCAGETLDKCMGQKHTRVESFWGNWTLRRSLDRCCDLQIAESWLSTQFYCTIWTLAGETLNKEKDELTFYGDKITPTAGTTWVRKRDPEAWRMFDGSENFLIPCDLFHPLTSNLIKSFFK